MRGTFAGACVGLAVLFGLILSVAPASAESGVLTLTGGQRETVATMTLNAGDVVEWAYSSGGSIKFAIDRTGTGEVFATSSLLGTGKFTAPSSGAYTFTFKNTGDNLTIVSYDLKGPFNWMPVIAAVGVGTGALVGAVGYLWYQKRKATPAPSAMPSQVLPPPPPA